MASKKFDILIDKLLRKTVDKTIHWHETASESAFRIALGEGLIRIERDKSSYYSAYLQNRKGRTLDQIGPLEDPGPLSKLFEAARESALGVDDLLERMVADMESGKTQSLPQEDEEGHSLPFVETPEPIPLDLSRKDTN